MIKIFIKEFLNYDYFTLTHRFIFPKQYMIRIKENFDVNKLNKIIVFDNYVIDGTIRAVAINHMYYVGKIDDNLLITIEKRNYKYKWQALMDALKINHEKQLTKNDYIFTVAKIIYYLALEYDSNYDAFEMIKFVYSKYLNKKIPEMFLIKLDLTKIRNEEIKNFIIKNFIKSSGKQSINNIWKL